MAIPQITGPSEVEARERRVAKHRGTEWKQLKQSVIHSSPVTARTGA